MLRSTRNGLRRWSGAVLAAVLLVFGAAAEGSVTRIAVDSITPLTAQDRAYEQVRGRAFGKLDPNDPHRAMAQGYLLQADHDALIAAADASNVLR